MEKVGEIVLREKSHRDLFEGMLIADTLDPSPIFMIILIYFKVFMTNL